MSYREGNGQPNEVFRSVTVRNPKIADEDYDPSYPHRLWIVAARDSGYLKVAFVDPLNRDCPTVEWVESFYDEECHVDKDDMFDAYQHFLDCELKRGWVIEPDAPPFTFRSAA